MNGVYKAYSYYFYFSIFKNNKVIKSITTYL